MKKELTVSVEFEGQQYDMTVRRVNYSAYMTLSAHFQDDGQGQMGLTRDGMMKIVHEDRQLIVDHIVEWPTILHDGEPLDLHDVFEYPALVGLASQIIAKVVETGVLGEEQRKN